jgi:hypothetical protein
MTTYKEVYNDIIFLIENNKIREAHLLFNQNIKRIHHMNDIVYLAFQNNKFSIGKELIKFTFIIRNQGYQYNYSPFDFFCHICKNDYTDILFIIIDDPYFWTKDKVIFEPEYKQTPKQWLIATAGYILCSLNKVKSLELLCNKYNITKFDADQSKFFEIASKHNYEELLNFLIRRYGSIVYEPINGIRESSLYDLPTFDGRRIPIVDEINNMSIENPMYIEMTKTNNNMSIENPMYIEMTKTNNNISIENPMYRKVLN